MNKHYEQAFCDLLNLVIRRKKSILQKHESIRTSLGSLFNFGDKQFSMYDSMVKSNEYSAVKTIETIALSLFTEKQYQYVELYPLDGMYKNYRSKEQAKTRPFQIVIKENNHKVGVIFTLFSNAGEYYKRFTDGEYSVDSLQMVILAEPNDIAYETVIAQVNTMNDQAGIAIERITVQQFWEKHFGIDEYKTLKFYVDEFNTKVTEIIGFQTVLSPTEEAIKKFREKVGKELVTYPYTKNIPDNIYPHQIEILSNNYIDRGLWRAMIGENNYAVSFITSEWYYKVYQLSESLDLTNVVSGYLKSIEQLLV